MANIITTSPHLAQTLRSIRKGLGLTQAQAAERVGLLPKTVSGLETRPEASSLESLFKLLSALDLELELRPKSRSPGGKPSKGEW